MALEVLLVAGLVHILTTDNKLSLLITLHLLRQLSHAVSLKDQCLVPLLILLYINDFHLCSNHFEFHLFRTWLF